MLHMLRLLVLCVVYPVTYTEEKDQILFTWSIKLVQTQITVME